MTVVLRRGGAQDARFLRDMLVHAYYWRARVPGSLVSRYVRGWGRPGDTAVVTCTENVLTSADVGDNATVVATNVFVRRPDGWRLQVHHGSPVLGRLEHE